MVTDAEIDEPGPRVLYVNPEFTRMTGYEQADLQNQSPRILQGPKTDRLVLDRLRRCLEAGKRFEGETINYRKDGTPFIMRWYIEPIHGSEGRITHWFAVQRDVTKEREDSKQQRALEQAVGQLTDSVILFGRDGAVRFANEAYLRWSRLRADQVLGQPAWRLPGAPERRFELVFARHMLSLGRDWQREYAVRRGGGDLDQRFVFVSVSPIRDPAGEIAEYVAVCRDATKRRRLESIAEANNFHDNLGYVFSGIRHELGNPINSIKTALELVSSSLGVMPMDKVREYLERMGEEVGRVEYLLRSLRSYSLYDKPRLESIQLPSFLSRFGHLVEPDLERRGVRMSIELESRADIVWADPQALHQILFNLITNALTALDQRQDGHVTLRATRRGEHIALEVLDNGPGIPADHLPHLFKPFYTTRHDGTGLGLPISRHLLSLMRGSIDISSSSTGTEAKMLLDRQDPGQRGESFSQ